MKKSILLFLMCLMTCIGTIQAQTSIPYFPLKGDFGGTRLDDLRAFIPNLGEYTLEVQGTQGTEIRIAFAGISYTPAISSTVRFTQKDGKVYVFENGLFKAVLTPNPDYTTGGDNLIRNPGFEEVETEVLASGRWKPAVWDTWNGGMPTWGSETGKTNVREDAAYRSEGTKSVIMHSETRQLLQELPENALQAGAYYLLTYDYWTSAGYGNGGTTYTIYLKKERHDNEFQMIPGHTTLESGTAQSSFSTLFRVSEEVPETVWFVLQRNEDKVDWLDNFKLCKIEPSERGITGVASAVYLSGTAYAPENLSFENGDHIDMTGRMVNPGFDNNTTGWTIDANGSKISTGEKGAGLIPGNQNHLQFWVGSGGIKGTMYQRITNLPNGKYTVKAAVIPSFSGTVSLYANTGKAAIASGNGKYYETTGIVFDGSLETGLEINTSGSPTIDLDDFRLYYLGMDGDGYLQVLNAKIAEAKADTLAMHHTAGKPGYNNLPQYREALKKATNRPDDEAATLIEALALVDATLTEYGRILEAYTPLQKAIDNLKAQLASSGYPNGTSFQEAIRSAQEIYDSPEDQRTVIAPTIAGLTGKSEILATYQDLKTALTGASTMLATNDYPGKAELRSAIDAAQEIATNPEGKDLAGAIASLRKARTAYYNSQFTIQPVKKVVSWVDTSMEGAEKYVLRVDGKPFYMTNIQVRLDKLYGYQGWSDAALEAVVKRAADDGFNTVSIPVHWREVEPVKDEFDWTILDKFMGWCRKYGLKMEMLWFSWSSGGRVQYLMNTGGVQTLRTPDYVCSLEGKSEFNMLRKEWEYSLDWRDTKLREREKYVLGQVMEHIAVWDANNGNHQTVIGVQLGNEARGHGNNSATNAEIINYYHHVGGGVKESKYVTWTRLNCVSYETPGRISANESKRNSGGTNIDFVGIDIYGTSASSILGNMNGQLPHTGKNYSMIMEIDAKDSNSPIYQMAALAGNKAFDYYNMAVVDGNALYLNNGTTLTERSHISEVRQRNKILNLANQDIALKAQGGSLYVYNHAGNSTNSESGLEGISFKPSATRSQAIAIRRNSSEIVLLVTLNGTFTLPSALKVVSASKGYFDAHNEWVNEGDIALTSATLTMPATSAVLLKLEAKEEEKGIKNPSFESGSSLVNGINVPLYWTLKSSLGGSVDVKLSTASPAHGSNKYSIWASSVSSIDLYQDVDLPKGEYVLKAAMHTDSKANITDQHIYAKVGNNAALESAVLEYAADPFWYPLEVEFTVTKENETVRLGAASTGSGSTAGWFQIDDFKLENKDDTSVDRLETEEKAIRITNAEGGVWITCPGEKPAGITIHSLTGQLIKRISASETPLFVPLVKGSYIIGGQRIIVI